MKVPRILLAGVTSGVGKTSISCGLVHALLQHGYSVQPFKVGPDYIDPSYLSSISGNETCNLDAWLMGRDRVLQSFISNSGAAISVIEGVMGFYDGFGGDSDLASTHHIASITKTPVILVLDASKTSRSVAAIASGFRQFHRNSRIRGVILNKLGSRKHELLCRQALKQARIPVFGAVYRDPKLGFRSQHMGLVPATQSGDVQRRLHSASKHIADSLEVEGIIKMAMSAPELPKMSAPGPKKRRATIAVALDDSFNFYYRDNLAALQREGAALEFFSPAKDRQLCASDGIYIGGGFPEILGDRLEKNQSMQKKIKKLAEEGMPIYAECGGLMYLTKSITHAGKSYKMAGLFDAETHMTEKIKLNYTRGRIADQNILSYKPHTFHGHEFHYSELRSVPSDSRFAYALEIGMGIEGNRDGLMLHNTLASYGHLYFDSSNYAKAFTESCMGFSRI